MQKVESNQHKQKLKLQQGGLVYPLGSAKESYLNKIGEVTFEEKTRPVKKKKGITWADQVGRPIARCAYSVGEGRDAVKGHRQWVDSDRQESRKPCPSAIWSGSGRSYKEALLKPTPARPESSSRLLPK